MPYNKWGKRYWLALYEYQKDFPGDNIFYPPPDYRKDDRTCKWCGQPLKSKRQISYCCKDCSTEYAQMTVWGRGHAPLPYRILCRDNFTCQECGEFLAFQNEHGMFIPCSGKLDVHHLIKVSEGGLDHQSNLITLCSDCHKDRHKG